MADKMSVRTFIGVSNNQHERLGYFKNEMGVPCKRGLTGEERVHHGLFDCGPAVILRSRGVEFPT